MIAAYITAIIIGIMLFKQPSPGTSLTGGLILLLCIIPIAPAIFFILVGPIIICFSCFTNLGKVYGEYGRNLTDKIYFISVLDAFLTALLAVVILPYLSYSLFTSEWMRNYIYHTAILGRQTHVLSNGALVFTPLLLSGPLLIVLIWAARIIEKDTKKNINKITSTIFILILSFFIYKLYFPFYLNKILLLLIFTLIISLITKFYLYKKGFLSYPWKNL